MAIDPINVGVVLVAILTVLGGWLTQRTASKASRLTSKETAEVEAYSRARTMDLKTIERQDEEIKELGEMVTGLRQRLANKNKIIDDQEKLIDDQRIIIRALRRNMGVPELPEQRSEEKKHD